MSGEVCYRHSQRAIKPVVPEFLRTGLTIYRITDGEPYLYIFRVDEYGFYLSAHDNSKQRKTLSWDLCLISDVRINDSTSICKRKRDTPAHLKELLYNDGGDNVISLVYRKDGITNLEFTTLVCQTSQDAKAFMVAINLLTHNLWHMNASIGVLLRKLYIKIKLQADPQGYLRIKSIAKVLGGKNSNLTDSISESLQLFRVTVTSQESGPCVVVDDFTFKVFEDTFKKITNASLHTAMVFPGFKIPKMSPEQLLYFLNKEQRDPRDNEVVNPPYLENKAHELIETFEPNGLENARFTTEGMWSFLTSEESNVVSADQLPLNMDMSQPLSHYYINSSHNTYCIGAQVRGQSSVEIYRQCLLLGCRCVELDCWINNDDVIITHGIMQGLWVCTTISFEQVLRAINDYAFVTTDYPLILSIENHVDRPHLLRRMATLYTLVFGNKLLKEPIEGHPIEPGCKLPSPDMLRGKILLKDKIRLKKRKDAGGISDEARLAAMNSAIIEEDEPSSTPTSPVSRSHELEDAFVSSETDPSLPTDSNSRSNSTATSSPSNSGSRIVLGNNNSSHGDGGVKSKTPPISRHHKMAHSSSDSKMLIGSKSLKGASPGNRVSPSNSRRSIGSLRDVPTSSGSDHVMLDGGPVEFTVSMISRKSPDRSGGSHDHNATSDNSKTTPTITVETNEVNSPDDDAIVKNGSQWQDHVMGAPSLIEGEQQWIVDDFTLRRPPKQAAGTNSKRKELKPDNKNMLSESCPVGVLPVTKKIGDDQLNDSIRSSNSEGHHDSVEGLQLPPGYVPRPSEGMALVGGPIIELLNYCTAIKFEGFEEAERRNHWNHVASMDEEKGFQNLLDSPREFVKYNARQFSRIYPAGIRMNSSNYLPQLYWDAGCQMVALNYQTSDISMQLNCGKFEPNLNCGYILKPKIMRMQLAEPFNMFEQNGFVNVVPFSVTLKILSGLFLSERQNTVDVEVYGLPADTMRKGSLRTRPQQGPHPMWKTESTEEKFDIDKVILPELVLLRFTVTDDKGDLVGQRVLPLSSIRSGYRFIPLRDKHSFPLPMCLLFVYTEISYYVPDKWKVLVENLVDPLGRLYNKVSMLMDDDDEASQPAQKKDGKISTVSLQAIVQLNKQSSSNKVDVSKSFPEFGTRDSPITRTKSVPSKIPYTPDSPGDVMLEEIKERESVMATRPDDEAVRSSKRMIKCTRKMDKERIAHQAGLNLRLDQLLIKRDRLTKKAKSTEHIEEIHQDYSDSCDQARSEFKELGKKMKQELLDIRYRKLAVVLSMIHQQQVVELKKYQLKEVERFRSDLLKQLSSKITEMINLKTNTDKAVMEKVIFTQRMKISEICAVKITQLRDHHELEMRKLMHSQKQVQEQLEVDKRTELDHVINNTLEGESPLDLSNHNNNSNHKGQRYSYHEAATKEQEFVWDY